MKKYLIIAACALVASVACTKSENEAPDSLVSFQVANYKAQTKANVSALTEFKSFTCKAFLHADGYESTTQNFFGANGETIVPDNESNPTQWAPSHDYYWPKSNQSYINFVAWYDKAGAPTTATETSLEWAARTISPTDTILFADEAWRYKDNNGAIYKKDAVTKGVPMLFHHALAQINIKAKGVELNDGASNYWRVVLDTVKIANIYKTGTLSLVNSDPSTTQPKEWTAPSSPAVWASPSNADEIKLLERESDISVTDSLTTTAKVLLEGNNVLPQALTNDHVLTVVFSIYRKNQNGYYSNERICEKIKLSDFSNSVSAWEMNKKITYTIIINPKTEKVLLDPAIEEWTEVDGGEYNIGTGAEGERLNG